METRQPSDSVDLSKSFYNLVRLLASNVLTISIVLAVCIGIGIVLHLRSPKIFESKMILQSDILSESYSLKLAENLNDHIKDSDIDYLASSLKLTSGEASLLSQFKIASALTPMSQQMPEKEKIIIVVTVRVSDNAILPKLQEGIIHYFTSNEYIKKRVEQNRQKFQGLVDALDREIKMMDTLKAKILKGNFSAAGKGEVSIVDVSGLYEVSADLYEKKYDFMIDLATVDSIQVIENFTPYGKPVWPKLLITMFSSLTVAFIAIFVILLAKSFRQMPAK